MRARKKRLKSCRPSSGLSTWRSLRCCGRSLVELAAERYLLMFDMHHIVSDGVSMDVLVEELVRLYGGELLEPLRIQYKDYAVWQQSDEQKVQLKREEAYWLDRYRGELPVLEMPTDYPRPAVQSFEDKR